MRHGLSSFISLSGVLTQRDLCVNDTVDIDYTVLPNFVIINDQRNAVCFVSVGWNRRDFF